MSDETAESEAMANDRGERGFLHDISSPLAVGQGNLRIIISKLKADPPAIAGQPLLEKLEKVMTSFEKIMNLVNDRRQATRKALPEEDQGTDQGDA